MLLLGIYVFKASYQDMKCTVYVLPYFQIHKNQLQEEREWNTAINELLGEKPLVSRLSDHFRARRVGVGSQRSYLALLSLRNVSASTHTVFISAFSSETPRLSA